MGPTNIALVKLFEADQELREAQGRLESATRELRIHERRVRELEEKIRLTRGRLHEQQSHAANLELDIKAKDAQIERLRTQQQTAHTSREYQAFLVEINTHKVDRGKIEDEAISVMEAVEKEQNALKDLTAQLEAQRAKLAGMQNQMSGRVAELQAEIDRLRPARDEAAAAAPAKARETFERIAERYDGEAMAAIGKPNPRREEYLCTACNMDLVPDIYNKLHARDDIVLCPSCGRILFIPDDLPPELAVHRKKASAPQQA